jgi:hypothetical protein
MRLPFIAALLSCLVNIAAPSFGDPTSANPPQKANKQLTAAPIKPSPSSSTKPNPAATKTPAKVGTAVKTGAAGKSSSATSAKITSKAPAKTGITTARTPGTSSATNKATSAPVPAAAAAPSAKAAQGSQKSLALQGYVKHHHHKPKHELGSLLKKEFDSPIHAVETDNKDF